MKLDNFELTRTKGQDARDLEFFAVVDVTTGVLWWKKITRKEIWREYGGFWHFVETGEFTPGLQVEELARAWKAKTGQQA